MDEATDVGPLATESGRDEVAELVDDAVAKGAKVLIGGGQYLLGRIDPATPAEIADPMREFGNKLMDFGTAAMAGSLNTDLDQTSLSGEIDALNTQLQQLCQ